MEKAEKITDGYREAVKNASAALEEIKAKCKRQTESEHIDDSCDRRTYTLETLEKQLQLLSERSHKAYSEPFICELTQAMVQVAKVICCI